MNRDDQRFQNPPDYRYFWFITAISIIFGYGLGVLLFLIRENQYITLFVMFFLGTSGILIMWNREFIARPSEVVIAKEGLVLSFRYGRKQRKVSWDEVLGAKGFVEENGGVFRRLDGEGALALVDRLYYVNYPISRSINETYFKNRGLRLLEWKKGEDFKDFKKRATIKKS